MVTKTDHEPRLYVPTPATGRSDSERLGWKLRMQLLRSAVQPVYL